MLIYTLKRLLQGVITVWFIATATFIAMHNIPGNPLQSEKAVSEEVYQNMLERYGLDKPVWEQYYLFMSKMVFDFDFGVSFQHEGRSVNDIIAERFPVSAILGILAIVFAGVGGILWGL